MTRVLSALLLACFAWSQAFAADCPLAASAAGVEAHASAQPMAMHGGHASTVAHRAGAPVSGPHGAPSEHHRATECVLAMSCGVAALPRAAHTSSVPAQPSAHVAWPATAAYLSPALGSDPPPPRLA